MKNFYSHLISYEDLIEEIEKLSLEPKHKQDLCQLIDNLIHNLVLDTTLGKLESQDKIEFFKMLDQKISSKIIIRFLTKKIKDYDTILKFEIDNLKTELLIDIKQAQNISTKY